MLRLTGAVLCGLFFCFAWPIFITQAFVYSVSLLLLRSGHDWDAAFYFAYRLERKIMMSIDEDWQIVLMFSIVVTAAMGGGAVAGILARGRAYIGASLIVLICGLYIIDYYVDGGGTEHLWFALFLLACAACVFLGCFAARFLGPRIRWP